MSELSAVLQQSIFSHSWRYYTKNQLGWDAATVVLLFHFINLQQMLYKHKLCSALEQNKQITGSKNVSTQPFLAKFNYDTDSKFLIFP